MKKPKKSMQSLIKRYLFADVPEVLRGEYDQYCARHNAIFLPLLALALVVVQTIYLLHGRAMPELSAGRAGAYIPVAIVYIILQLCAVAAHTLLYRKGISASRFVYAHLALTLLFEVALAQMEGGYLPATFRYTSTLLLVAVLPSLSRRGIAALFIPYIALMLIGISAQQLAERAALPLIYLMDILLGLLCIALANALLSQRVLSFVDTERMRMGRELLERANADLERMSHTDPLTQVNNRRGFDLTIEKSWKLCSRAKSPLSVLMLDLDHFKAYNDYFGHLLGDECLKTVAEAIHQCARREVDYVARFGGEEFAVLLPFTTLEEAKQRGEAICRSVAEKEIAHPRSPLLPYMTLSVGVATCVPSPQSDPRDLVDMADSALYLAKESGRNRVVCSQDMPDEDMSRRILFESDESYTDELARMRAILRTATVLTFLVDLVTGELIVSDEIMELCDVDTTIFSREEDLARVVVPQDVPRLMENLRAMAHGEVALRGREETYRLRLRGGGYLWVLSHVALMPVESGKSRYITGALTDISQLMYMRDVYHLVAEGATDYPYYYNFATDTLEVNANFREDFALESSTIANASRAFFRLVLPQDRRKARKALFATLRGEKPNMDVIIRLDSPAKGVIYAHCRGQLARDHSGNEELFAGSMADITAEIQTRKTNRLIIEGATECVFVLDLHKDVMQLSPKIRDILPVPSLRLDPAMESWLEMIYVDDRERYIALMEPLLTGETDDYSLEFRLYGRGGEPVWIAMRGMCERDDAGIPAMIAGSIFDLDAMGEYNRHIEQLSLLDPLTGQPNRFSFYRDMQSQLNEDGYGHVIMFDIDEFKRFNSMFSHSHGDKLLKDISNILKSFMPETGKVYHFEADLFAMSIEGADEDAIHHWMRQFRRRYPAGIPAKNTDYRATLSMSVVEYSKDHSVDELLVNADIAMQKAKSGAKGSYVIFSSEDKESYLSRLELDEQLRRSVQGGCEDFILYYQPLFGADAETLVGSEALLRFRSVSGDILPPIAFIGNLEESGLMLDVENWVLRRAIAQCATWRRERGMSNFIMNVNLSSACIYRDDLYDTVIGALEENGLPPGALTLEITEAACVLPMKNGLQTLERLREYGVSVAIDDFGTGYSSLSYLKNLPVNETKIDRAFVLEIEKDPSNLSFVASIIQLAHSLDHLVCVEGVETEEQANMLREIGADILQGYYFSRPVASPAFERAFLPAPRAEEL